MKRLTLKLFNIKWDKLYLSACLYNDYSFLQYTFTYCWSTFMPTLLRRSSTACVSDIARRSLRLAVLHNLLHINLDLSLSPLDGSVLEQLCSLCIAKNSLQ